MTAVAGPADTGTPGLYQVTFNRDLSACVAVASRTSPDGNFPGIGGAAANHADATSMSSSADPQPLGSWRRPAWTDSEFSFRVWNS